MHSGQQRLRCNHLRIHVVWNLWVHGKLVTTCPASSCSRQMQHATSSDNDSVELTSISNCSGRRPFVFSELLSSTSASHARSSVRCAVTRAMGIVRVKSICVLTVWCGIRVWRSVVVVSVSVRDCRWSIDCSSSRRISAPIRHAPDMSSLTCWTSRAMWCCPRLWFWRLGSWSEWSSVVVGWILLSQSARSCPTRDDKVSSRCWSWLFFCGAEEPENIGCFTQQLWQKLGRCNITFLIFNWLIDIDRSCDLGCGLPGGPLTWAWPLCWTLILDHRRVPIFVRHFLILVLKKKK